MAFLEVKIREIFADSYCSKQQQIRLGQTEQAVLIDTFWGPSAFRDSVLGHQGIDGRDGAHDNSGRKQGKQYRSPV